MKLYFARHGESVANVQRIHWNKPHGYGLTEKGREQAEALAADLADIPSLLPSNVDKAFVMSRPPFDGSFYVIAELRGSEWVCLRWGEEVL